MLRLALFFVVLALASALFAFGLLPGAYLEAARVVFSLSLLFGAALVTGAALRGAPPGDLA
jgi:hypothetical protein